MVVVTPKITSVKDALAAQKQLDTLATDLGVDKFTETCKAGALPVLDDFVTKLTEMSQLPALAGQGGDNLARTASFLNTTIRPILSPPAPVVDPMSSAPA